MSFNIVLLYIINILLSILGGIFFEDHILEEGLKGIKNVMIIGGTISLITLSVSWVMNPSADAATQFATLFIGAFVNSLFAMISAQVLKHCS